jgi:hypothetical protein
MWIKYLKNVFGIHFQTDEVANIAYNLTATLQKRGLIEAAMVTIPSLVMGVIIPQVNNHMHYLTCFIFSVFVRKLTDLKLKTISRNLYILSAMYKKQIIVHSNI